MILPVTERPPHRYALSEEGTRLVTADRGGRVRLWDTRTGSALLDSRLPSGVRRVGFEGGVVVAVTDTGDVRLGT